MFGKRAAKKAAAEPVVELTPFQKAAQERAEMKPFENSQYWVCRGSSSSSTGSG